MLLACVFYAFAVCLCSAVRVASNPLSSLRISRISTPQSNTIEGGSGGGEELLTGSRLAVERDNRSPLRDVLPVQAALLPSAPSVKTVPTSMAATFLPRSTPTAIPTPSTSLQALELGDYGAARSMVTQTPLLRTQSQRGSPGNITATRRLTTTLKETTTVFVDPDDCTGTPTPTAAMARYSIPISDAGQKGGIAGGTVGAVLIAAVMTVFCYRRVRRRTRESRGFKSLSGSGSAADDDDDDDDAERGMVAHGGLFGPDDKTASAAESLATSAPQVLGPSDPSVVTTRSQEVAICFRPSRRLISRYPSLPVTPPRASARLSDYLNPVVREMVLLPRPLRLAGRAALGRARSWQAGRRPGRKGGSRSRSMTATDSSSSSMYSTNTTFEFAEYGTIGARTSRGTGTGTGSATATQRASGTTDVSGLRSTLAHFPRPPPYTFHRGDGRGLGTSWRESFVFSTPDDDEVLLAFPELARQMGEDVL